MRFNCLCFINMSNLLTNSVASCLLYLLQYISYQYLQTICTDTPTIQPQPIRVGCIAHNIVPFRTPLRAALDPLLVCSTFASLPMFLFVLSLAIRRKIRCNNSLHVVQFTGNDCPNTSQVFRRKNLKCQRASAFYCIDCATTAGKR